MTEVTVGTVFRWSSVCGRVRRASCSRSGAMARTKVASIQRTGADAVVGVDASCLMQIQGALSRADLPITTMHLAEVLASR